MFRAAASLTIFFRSLKSAALSVPLASTVLENLNHVQAADRTVGVQARNERRQGRVLQGPGSHLHGRRARQEPAFAVIVQLPDALGAVNSPAAVIAPPLALQANVGCVVMAFWNWS